MRVEDGAVSPQAAGLKISTAGIHATDRHAIGGRVGKIVNNATGGL
jgi:hypothetical protein